MAGLLGPDGRPIRRDAALLVDAYGRPVRARTGAALPDRPRLRALEVVPVREDEREGLLVRDPTGVSEAPAFLRLEVLPLLQLLDGTRSLDEICTRVVAESGDPAHAEAVRRFIEDLDGLYLLESPRYEARRRELDEAYRRLPVRDAVLAGISYPAEPGEAEKFLGGHYAEAKAMRSAAPEPRWPEAPAAVAIPHLDLRRSGPVVALGLLSVPETPPPDVVFLFGTGHALYERVAALTPKRLATPLGDLEPDTESVEIALSHAGEEVLAEERAVREEHSIEFSALHLAYRFRPAPRVVTAIFGGFHRILRDGHAPDTEPLYRGAIQGLRAALARARERGRRVLCLAAVDLSHVGPRFGEPPPDGAHLDSVRRLDEEALAQAATGKARGWYEAIARHDDSTSICGFSAMHALLEVARPGPGAVLRYEQSPEPGGSVVTCASLAWGEALAG
jgi:hypothetical protein